MMRERFGRVGLGGMVGVGKAAMGRAGVGKVGAGIVAIVAALAVGCGGSSPTALPLEAESAFDVAVGDQASNDPDSTVAAGSPDDDPGADDNAAAETATSESGSMKTDASASEESSTVASAVTPPPAQAAATERPTATSAPRATATPEPLPTPSVESVADMVERVRDGVIFVETKGCDGSGSGTGFVIDDSRIVTAAHVLEGANLVIVNVGGERVTAQIVGIDRELDVALLSVPETLNQWHFSFADNVRIGDEALVMGFPDALDFTVTQGAVTATDAKERGISVPIIRVDAAINPGNSGGPVVNRAGEVLGVVNSVRTNMQNTNYAIDGQAALTRLESWSTAKPYPPTANCGRSSQPAVGSVAMNANHPQAAVVDNLFEVYVGGINSGLTEYSWDVLTPGFQAAIGTRQYFASSNETSFLYDFTVLSIADTPSGLDVQTGFVSTQEPSYGPNGWACAVWLLDYSLVPDGGSYLIDGARHRQGSPANCDDFR